MAVELTSPVEGKAVGETYSGDREDWLVEQGYAKRGSGKAEKSREDSPEVEEKQAPSVGDFRNATDVKADKDPTLAQNREHRDEPTPHEVDPTTEIKGPGATQEPSTEQAHGVPDPSTVVPGKDSTKLEKSAEKVQAKQK